MRLTNRLMAPICAVAAIAGAPAYAEEPAAASAVQSTTAVFCKEVPIEGTRFTNKRCVPADQFSAYLSQLQAARDAAIKDGCYGADFCGNVQSMVSKPRMSMGSSR